MIVADEDVLAHELECARAELRELEQAVETIPKVFEDKFRQRLVALDNVNQQLARERQDLIEELHGVLRPHPVKQPRRLLRLIQWSLPQRRRIVVGVIVLTVLPLFGWAVRDLGPRFWRPAKQAVSTSVSRRQDSVLTLRATGSTWLEVQDLQTREVVLIGVLKSGDQRLVRMPNGLRLRSGRPDLLLTQIDDGPQQPLGQIDNMDWRTLQPPPL